MNARSLLWSSVLSWAADEPRQPACGAEDGSVKVFIVARVMFPTAPHAFPRRHVKDEHAKDAAQLWRALWRACHRTWRRTWASGPGRRAPSSPRHHRRRRLCASRAEMGAQLGRSVAFGSGCGQALPGVPRKALLCFLKCNGGDIEAYAPLPFDTTKAKTKIRKWKTGMVHNRKKECLLERAQID